MFDCFGARRSYRMAPILVLVAGLLPGISLGAASAERVTLARAGKPAATIVIPAAAPERVQWAAGELQQYVKKISGVTLPLNTDGQRVPGVGLYIGQCEPTTAADLPPAKANPETYAIRVRGGNLFFTGHHPTPTAFAVVSFLEENLGVRWFAPGELWEYVPAGKPGELTVNVRSRVKTPDTSPRIWSGHAWTESWQTWNLRNKTVLSEVVPQRQFQNNVYRALPVSRFSKTHPEYYPLMKDGRRWMPTDDSSRYWRPCESHPEVQNTIVTYARRWFDANPTTDSFSVGMDDITHLCACNHCRAWDPHPDSYEKRAFSDRHYKFVNAIAREIAKTHPDRYIGTLIYNIALELPETVDRLEPNVFGYITETSARWYDPERKANDQRLTREWRKRCAHLSRYDYYGMGGMTPRVYPHTMAEQIRFDKSLGLTGMYIEVYTFLPNTAPMIWSLARMQWDAKADVDALLNEFYAKMFGPASGTMRAYFELLERSWNTPRPGRDGWVHRNLIRQALAMSPEDVDEGFRLLARAKAQAKSDAERRRIDVVEGGLRYGSHVIRSLALSQKATTMPVTSEAEAREVFRMASEISRLSVERQRFWEEATQRDDLLGDTVRGLGEMGYLAAGQTPNVEGGAWMGALRALGWLQENAPDKLESTAADLLKLAPEGDVSQLVRAWLTMAQTKPQSLLENSRFEEAGANQQPAAMDWSTEGAPKGWSVWSRGPSTRLAVLGGKGRDGSHAASITGADSATYIQSVPAKPGERYLVSVWVKGVPGNQLCGASLRVRFRTPTGAWYPRHEVEPNINLTAISEEWQQLLLLVTVPEGAAQIVVMPGASGQGEGVTALFDDVGLYRIAD